MALSAFHLTELDRRVANVVRIGRVHAVDLSGDLPRVRVRLGELTTGWLPFCVLRAGGDTSWWPIEAEEQVVVVAPSGDLAQGIVIGSLFQSAFSPPSLDEDSVRYDFSDGAAVAYDKRTHRLTATLPAQGTFAVSARGGIALEGDVTITGNLKASGDIEDATRSMAADRAIYNQHMHGGVTTGTGLSAPTGAKQ